MVHKNILSRKQLSVLEKLSVLPKGSYMAGGTALALQLGHRTSFDFDFYTREHFRVENILKALEDSFDSVVVEKVANDTLIAELDGVSFSLFYYPYELIKPPVSFGKVKLASVDDIAAMKMVAISMRGKRRDFIDAYCLLKKFSIEELIKTTIKKYPSYQPMVILKGLIYFKDAMEDEVSRKIQIFDKNYSWDKAKKKIFGEVKRYQLGMIKK